MQGNAGPGGVCAVGLDAKLLRLRYDDMADIEDLWGGFPLVYDPGRLGQDSATQGDALR